MFARRYQCSVCHQTCAEVELQAYEEPSGENPEKIYALHIGKFLGHVEFRLDKDTYRKILSHYEKDQLHEIHDFFDLYAPFYCRGCGATYCQLHWSPWVEYDDGFYDAQYGICPSGHKQLLDD